MTDIYIVTVSDEFIQSTKSVPNLKLYTLVSANELTPFYMHFFAKGGLFHVVAEEVKALTQSNNEYIREFSAILAENESQYLEFISSNNYDVNASSWFFKNDGEVDCTKRTAFSLKLLIEVACIVFNVPCQYKHVYNKLLSGFVYFLEKYNLYITYNFYSNTLFHPEKYLRSTRLDFTDLTINTINNTNDTPTDNIKYLFILNYDMFGNFGFDKPLNINDLNNLHAIPKNKSLYLYRLIKKNKVFTYTDNEKYPFSKKIKSIADKIHLQDELIDLKSFFNLSFEYILPKIIFKDKFAIIDIREANNNISDIIDSIASYQKIVLYPKNLLGERNSEILVKMNKIIDMYEKNKHNINTPSYRHQDVMAVLLGHNKKIPFLIFGPCSLAELIKKYPNEKRLNYLDSSIWIRYVSTNAEKDSLSIKFEEYSKAGLYDRANPKNSLILNARMALNTYLGLNPEKLVGSYIIPVAFHSESTIKSEHKKKINALNVFKFNRRVLIIDDRAYLEKEKREQKVRQSKCQVIRSLLAKDFNVRCSSDCYDQERCGEPILRHSSGPNNTITLDCALSADHAIKKIKERRYDIILLDDMLGWQTNDGSQSLYKIRGEYYQDHKCNTPATYEQVENCKREYSIDFLEKIDKIYNDQNGTQDKEWSGVKGIFDKFWIFHISPFSATISVKIHSNGMVYNTPYWHISRGACPETTPELFRYNLCKLMSWQYQVVTDIRIPKKYLAEDKQIITLIDYLYFIFSDRYSSPYNILTARKKAVVYFDSLLYLRAHYNKLRRDYKFKGEIGRFSEGSPFVQGLFHDIDHYSNSFWEHLQQLIYLIAFGTIRQWSEMWEEYIFIMEKLKQADKDGDLSQMIEQYIFKLKKEG